MIWQVFFYMEEVLVVVREPRDFTILVKGLGDEV